jgi:hypothetical protein
MGSEDITYRSKDQGRSVWECLGKRESHASVTQQNRCKGKNDLHLDSNTFEPSNMDQKVTAPSRLPLLTSKDIILAASKNE